MKCSFLFNSKGILVALLLLCNLLYSQETFSQIRVKGKVIDSHGTSLGGVTVIVKGTTVGTITDQEGNYSISAPSREAELQFSFIGYITKEITVGNQTTIDVTLSDKEVGIDEVIIVGYGTTKKSDLTGAISVVKGKELVNIPVRSAVEALQGKTAGISIVSTGGSPGTAPAVRIRGIGTVNGNDPLYIVDGFPQMDIGWLNQNDIASMEILKDASA
ncbi:MAG: carboxypeptidase-like regulatory domain-containing protein, partial [Bacteroidota bacterium]|nr:carboxypeptidase-like regulatory domain-containing protein [Bacteroidota bacterium]